MYFVVYSSGLRGDRLRLISRVSALPTNYWPGHSCVWDGVREDGEGYMIGFYGELKWTLRDLGNHRWIKSYCEQPIEMFPSGQKRGHVIVLRGVRPSAGAWHGSNQNKHNLEGWLQLRRCELLQVFQYDCLPFFHFYTELLSVIFLPDSSIILRLCCLSRVVYQQESSVWCCHPCVCSSKAQLTTLSNALLLHLICIYLRLSIDDNSKNNNNNNT